MRFIGSKNLLLEDIKKVLLSNVENTKNLSFCDIFSGTSTVARYFKKDYKILSNDLLYFSYVLQKATIENNSIPKFNKLKEILNINPIEYFNNIEVTIDILNTTPFIYENYSPNEKSERMYLSNKNALKIDYIRQKIEEWKINSYVNSSEYFYLIASLIEAVPYVSNIAGTYGAYLKHWDKRSFKDLELFDFDILDNKKDNLSFNQNANDLVVSISGDILYIDPPYNHRQYAPNYHLLETIARYDNPKIQGVTGIRPYDDIKSQYCVKRDVLLEFKKLIEIANFKYIVVSYSTEGIMSIDDIEKVLKSYGKKETYSLTKIPYRRYKHRAGVVKHSLEELIFFIEKESK